MTAAKVPSNGSKQESLSIPVGVDLVRFEKNLLQMGFFGANDVRRNSNTMRRIEQTVTREGQKIKVSAVFRSSLGLPSTSDRDKYLAFMRIAMRMKLKQGSVQNPVRFSGFHLLKELGVTDAGPNYEDINVWGQRMADTTITSEKVIYMAARKKYANTTVHVFRRFTRVGRSNSDGSGRSELFEIELEDWLLENLNSNYVVPEDFNAYCRLKRPTAKGIFGFLHLWFHASRGRDVERDYADLCMMLAIPCYRFVSKIQSTLGKALDELISIGYLSKWSILPMITKEGYKVVLTPGEEILRLLSVFQRRGLNETFSGNPELSLSSIQASALSALVSVGITATKAESLVRRYSAEFVSRQCEYAVHLIDSDQRGKIKNRAGFVIYSIESALPIPDEFVSPRKKQDSESRPVAAQELAELHSDYRAMINRYVDPEIERRFPGSSLVEKVEEILERRSPQEKEFDSAFPMHAFQIGREQIASEIRESLALPTFDEWRTSQTQRILR